MSQLDSRRSFLTMLGLTGIALLGSQKLFAEEKRRAKKPGAGGDAGLPLVEPGKGMAANMNYQHKHSDVKSADLKIVRSGVPFDKQYCDGCMLYASAGKQGGEDVGKCTLFAGQVVKAKGWCSSWAKKA